MKLKICFVVALAIGIAQADEVQLKDSQAQKKAASKKKSTPPAELTLPAGATMVEPGTYTFTDAQGKKWIYRKTPFGLARMEDKPADQAPAAAAASASQATTATEDGDLVRFERPGPFGTYRWQKKKTELDEDERAALERSRDQKRASAVKAKQE